MLRRRCHCAAPAALKSINQSYCVLAATSAVRAAGTHRPTPGRTGVPKRSAPLRTQDRRLRATPLPASSRAMHLFRTAAKDGWCWGKHCSAAQAGTCGWSKGRRKRANERVKCRGSGAAPLRAAVACPPRHGRLGGHRGGGARPARSRQLMRDAGCTTAQHRQHSALRRRYTHSARRSRLHVPAGHQGAGGAVPGAIKLSVPAATARASHCCGAARPPVRPPHAAVGRIDAWPTHAFNSSVHLQQ